MKTVLRKWLLILCASIMALVGVLGICMSISSDKVYASENLFEMVDGASVKINDDGGIRFKVKMDENTKNKIVNDEGGDEVNLYFLVTTQEIFNQVTEDKYFETLTAKDSRAIVIKVDESKIYLEDSEYFVNACVTNILEANRKLDYVAIAVIETDNGGEKTYDYASVDGKTVDDAEFSISNVRGNVYNILSQAVLDVEENFTTSILQSNAYKDWFGKGEYPLVIKTLTAYENLIKKINGGNDFGSVEVHVKDTFNIGDSTVELDSGKEMPVVKPFYTVTFMNEDGTVYQTVEVEQGLPAVVEAPTKAQTAESVFTFESWVTTMGGDTVQPLDNITASVTVYPKFSEEARKYSIVWKSYDDTTLKTDTIEYGLIPSYTDTLADYTVDGDVNVYAFTNWDNTPVAVTGDATYKAVYGAKDHYVASKLTAEDLGMYTNNIGNAVITRTTEASELPDGVSYGYKVTGTFDNVYTDMNHLVNGNFKAGEAYKFTVKYKGLSVSNLSHFHFAFDGGYGTAYNINAAKTITKIITIENDTTQLKFTSWLRESQNEGQGKTVSGSEMSFVFNIEFEKLNLYTITFKDAQGTVLDEQVVAEGEVPVYAGEQVEYEGSVPDGIVKYEMGWDKEIVAATANTVYTLEFKPVYKQQTMLYSKATGNKLYEFDGISVYRTTTASELPSGTSSAYIVDIPAWDSASQNVTLVNYLYGNIEAGKTYQITFKLNMIKLGWWYNVCIGTDSGVGEKVGGSNSQIASWGSAEEAAEFLSANGYSIFYTASANAERIYTVLRIFNPSNNTAAMKFALNVDFKEVNFYDVTWKNGDVVLETDTDVMEGTIPTFDGETDPVYSGEVPVGATGMEFTGWSPKVGAVTGDVTYVAQFAPIMAHQVKEVPANKLGTYLYNYENETIEYTTDTSILPAGAFYGWKITGSLSHGMYHQFVNVLNGNFKAGEKYKVVISVKPIELGVIDRIRIDPTCQYGAGFNIPDVANGKTSTYSFDYEVAADATSIMMSSYACKWNAGSSSAEEAAKVSSFVVSMSFVKITDTYDVDFTEVSWRMPSQQEIIYTDKAEEIPAGTTFAYIYKGIYSTGNTAFVHHVKGDFKANTTYSFTIKMKELVNPYYGSVYLDPTGGYANTYNLHTNTAVTSEGFTFTVTPTADTTSLKMTSTVNINNWNQNEPKNTEFAFAFNIVCNGEVTE